MKLNGFVGKGTGKLGASVFTVRKGEQIVREYTDKVTNPNTRPQVEQRAKFKLLSQLAAVVKSIGMHFEVSGPNVSMRNEFMKVNMPLVQVLPNSEQAIIDLSQLQLTSGSFPFATPEFNKTTGEVTIDLSASELANVAGVTVSVISYPELDRLVGYSVREERTEGAQTITVPVFVAPSMIDKTTVLVWLYRFADAAARTRYESAVGGATANQAALTFDRMVSEGAIEVSATVMANPTQA